MCLLLSNNLLAKIQIAIHLFANQDIVVFVVLHVVFVTTLMTIRGYLTCKCEKDPHLNVNGRAIKYSSDNKRFRL